MPKRILLADDSITIQKVVELSLSDAYEVRCVGTGEQAIRILEDFKPDLVLCDALMPEKNGYEVCSHIRKHPALSRTPVLMLHGAFESFDEGRARAVGADDILAKPFDTRTLTDKISALIAKAEAGAAEAEPEPEMPKLEEAPMEKMEEEVSEEVDTAFDKVVPDAPQKETSALERTVAVSVKDIESRLAEYEKDESAAADKPALAGKPALDDVVSEVDAEISKMDFGGDDVAPQTPSDMSSGDEAPSTTEPAVEVSHSPRGEATGETFETAAEKEEDEQKEESQIEAPAPTEEPSEEEIPAEAPPVFYDPPDGRMTEEDRAFAREIMESTSVPISEMLPEDIKAEELSATESAEADKPASLEEAAVEPAKEAEESMQETIEDMPTTELLKEVGDPQKPILSQDEMDQIVERAVKKISEKLIREIAWEVVPELAEILIRKKIEEIERATEESQKK